MSFDQYKDKIIMGLAAVGILVFGYFADGLLTAVRDLNKNMITVILKVDDHEKRIIRLEEGIQWTP